MNSMRQDASESLRSDVTDVAPPIDVVYASIEQVAPRTARRAAARSVDSLNATEQKILQGAMTALARQGSHTLSMRGIAHAARVSRGTLYRYFATKEDVLQAVSEFVSTSFERRMHAIALHYTDPLQLLQAAMALQLELANEKHIARIVEIEPALVLAFLRDHFERHVAAMKTVLQPFFELVEQRTAAKLDRDLFTAGLLRINLSTVIIPADPQWDAFPQTLAVLLRTLMPDAPALPARAARTAATPQFTRD